MIGDFEVYTLQTISKFSDCLNNTIILALINLFQDNKLTYIYLRIIEKEYSIS